MKNIDALSELNAKRNGVSLDQRLLEGLRHFKDRLSEERERRTKLGAECLSFGVKFLDEALGGVFQDDLVVIGARSGAGKTQLATLIAMENARMGKRVHFFALEASSDEIERRMKFQILSGLFFKVLRKEFPTINLNYLDWYYGRFDSQLGLYEKEIEETMSDIFPNLWTCYRTRDFTITDFEKQFLAIQNQTDLVIVDHLHYFDSDDENENRALKSIVKKIRDLALLCKKPVICLAHLRKSDRKAKLIAPGLDEFHGSSDITKIATKVITLAPCPQESGQGNRWPTYVRIPKCRVDGSRTNYVGLLGFNSEMNRYEDGYFLGRLSFDESEFEPIQKFPDIPFWAKGAKIMPQA